ncbi:hypothetical protein EJ08DRAFT_698196 [Tothia fuscella]|uniref:Peptidase M48 domain-containing protein n=1 Tax=Tothia fuscella TaxID=1048955 RepID=A0A9P4NQK7_9PEZI|nr:hypothetical protein EJ08DRAFT_698196 [Tothia fuscella]
MFFGSFFFGDAILRAASQLHLAQLQQMQEYEADAMGLILMTDAGFDPYTSLLIFSKIEVQENEETARMTAMHGDRVHAIPEAIRTHPLTSKRIEAMERQIPIVRALISGRHYLVQIDPEFQRRWDNFKAWRATT